MNKRKWILFLALFVMEVVLLVSGMGMISNGSLSITILQIPVILATVTLGLPYGMILGFTFGIGTMLITSRYGPETLDHLFANPLLSIIPRLMLVLVTWFVYRVIKRAVNDHTLSSECIAGGGAAFAGTITNTFLVTFSLCIIYPDMMFGESVEKSVYVEGFVNIIGANTSMELCVTVVLASIFLFFWKKKELQGSELRQCPLRKIFQKWLILFMSGSFLVTIFCTYQVQTNQAEKDAENYLDMILADTAGREEADDARGVSMSLLADSSILLTVKDGIIINGGMEGVIGKSLEEAGFTDINMENEGFSAVLTGSTYYCKAVSSGGVVRIGMLRADDVYFSRNETAFLLLLLNFVIIVLTYLFISKLLQDNVIKHIYHVNESLSTIQSGNLDEIVEIRNNKEFSVLSDGINATVRVLKDTMEEVAAKMNQEMEFAREIQHSVLPVAEHVAPEWKEYEILGRMDAAREVGGDFYDYFLIGDNRLGIVIADVSGKGVPAALFMMTAKALLKNLVLSGESPAEALELANTQLCENNEVGMFVTVWLGVLDFDIGELTFANAGHNPPLLKTCGGEFSYMDHRIYKRSIMLGIREGISYQNNRIILGRGDILYLYTDGVTEANNSKHELYGEERLKRCLECHYECSQEKLLQVIRADIDDFSGEAEQFDDITMVVLKMNVQWQELAVEAVYENTAKLAAFVEENLPEECSMKTRHQIAVAFDEIYSNVVKYSRAKQFVLRLGILKDMVCLEFIDDGIPFNPMEREEPDLKVAKEDRTIGGLGLFVVKQTMDFVDYQFRDQKNRFSVRKKFI